MTRLNGTVMQSAHTNDRIFPVPRLAAYISTFMTLQAGDVMEMEIGHVGLLRNV